MTTAEMYDQMWQLVKDGKLEDAKVVAQQLLEALNNGAEPPRDHFGEYRHPDVLRIAFSAMCQKVISGTIG